jgi:hypothetical protein
MRFRQEDRLQRTTVKDGVLAVFCALRSTLVIGAVALLVFAVRDGSFQWAKLNRVAVSNWRLFAMVFLGVLVWDYWFQRARRRRVIEQRDID